MKIHVLGDAFCDIVATGVPEMPRWGSGCKAEGIGPFAGGSGLNTTVQLSSLLSGAAGNEVTLFTALGDGADWASLVVEAQLKSFGVNLEATRLKNTSTGVCIVLSGSSERSFVFCAGAVTVYRLSNIDVARLADCDHLHLAGVFAFTSLAHDLPSLIKILRERNPSLTVSLDGNFDPSGNWGSPWMTELLPLVDVVRFSEEEAIAIQAKNSDLPGATKNTVSWLASQVRSLGVVSRGAEGASFALSSNPSEVFSIPSPRVQVVDSVGAGDAWNAGFLIHWLREKTDVKSAMRFAAGCGALAVTKVGACQMPVKLAEVEQLLASGKNY